MPSGSAPVRSRCGSASGAAASKDPMALRRKSIHQSRWFSSPSGIVSGALDGMNVYPPRQPAGTRTDRIHDRESGSRCMLPAGIRLRSVTQLASRKTAVVEGGSAASPTANVAIQSLPSEVKTTVPSLCSDSRAAAGVGTERSGAGRRFLGEGAGTVVLLVKSDQPSPRIAAAILSGSSWPSHAMLSRLVERKPRHSSSVAGSDARPRPRSAN